MATAFQPHDPTPARPVAIIDIGSNSVRLVTYDNLDRAPIPAFNEKSLCALGHGVVTTGKLPKVGVEKALVALRRYRALTEVMGITDVHVIATAAARDASNGPEFLAAARQALGGATVTLLSGTREARLSAFGVMSGVYDPDGVVGDLGGGSLELIDVRDGAVGVGVSLPFGGLALMDASSRSPKAAAKIVRDALAKCHALDGLQDRTFYAVGGTWRALAKLDMGQRHYPLTVMHGYRMSAREAADLAERVEQGDAASLAAIQSVNAARRPLLAYGAVVLAELIRRARPKDVVISTYGVREGLLYEALDPRQRDDDPLSVAAEKLNRLLAHSPGYARELMAWTDGLIRSANFAETPAERRLREAACALSEINWRAHPDYRGVQSFNLVSSAILPGVDHAARSFLSLVVRLRYEGLASDGIDPLRGLMSPAMIERAALLGAAFRVAAVFTAGTSGVLPRSSLSVTRSKLVLTVPQALADLANERVQSRMKALAKLLGREPAIAIA